MKSGAWRLVLVVAVLAGALAASAHGGGPSVPSATNGAIVFASPRAPDLFGEIYAVGADGGGRRNLSRSEHADESPVLTRSRRRVAFVSDRTGYAAVWTTTPGGRALRRVTGAFQGRRPTSLGGVDFSPDGRWLAFHATFGLFGRNEAYVVRASGGRARRIGVGGLFPAWSAAGNRIAYTDADASGGNRVVVVTPAGRRQWTRRGTALDWAPRGALIAYQILGPRGSIVIARANGTRVWSIRGETFGGWSPTGRAFAFTRGQTTYIGSIARRRILRLGRSIGGVSWSPDGRRLAWSVYDGNVLKVGAPGGRARTLPVRGWHSQWSPDGRRLLVLGSDGISVVETRARRRRVVAAVDPESLGVATWAGNSTIVYETHAVPIEQLWTIQPDGTRLERLTSDRFAKGSLAWSPDGRRIAFSRALWAGECRGCGIEIFVIAADGSGMRQVTSGPDAAQLPHAGSPAWSPNGERIAFTRSGPNDAPDIYVVNADGSGVPSRLTHSGSDSAQWQSSYAPAWSPDGEQIAFASSRDGGGIDVMRPDGTDVRRLVAAEEPRTPAWSPDGSRIAYRTADGISVLSLVDRSVEDLVGTGQCSSGLAWSPDGAWLAFGDCAGRPQSTDLFLVSADASTVLPLTRDRAPNWGASWQPLASPAVSDR